MGYADPSLYSPRIKRSTSGTLLLHPDYTPLNVVSQQYVNRITSAQIPLQDGAVIFDARRGPVTVSFQGVISNADTPEEMRLRMTTLHTYLIGGKSSPLKFTFYRYFNPGVGYRYWRNCVCSDLAFDDGSRTVKHMPYSFTIMSEDGCEYLDLVNPDIGDTHDADNPTVTETLEAPQIVRLADSAGASKFNILNSDDEIVFQVDSQGNCIYTGTFMEVDSIDA